MLKMKKTTKLKWLILVVGLIPLVIMNELLVSRDVDSTLRIAFAAFYYVSLKGISYIIIRKMEIKEESSAEKESYTEKESKEKGIKQEANKDQPSAD